MMRVSASQMNKEVDYVSIKDTKGTQKLTNSGDLLPYKEYPIFYELTCGLLHLVTQSDRISKVPSHLLLCYNDIY